MASPSTWSFRALADKFVSTSQETFLHHWQDASLAAQLPSQFRPKNWDYPGLSGEERPPKYLYRGEAGIYSSSLPSRTRISTSFDDTEVKLLDDLTDMASWCWRLRFGDPFRSIGWPQHYGFPTLALDLTSDPLVALHFAADAPKAASTSPRNIYRLDLEAVVSKVYGPANQPTPLALASIAHEFCNRAVRQSAYIICNSDTQAPLDFQRCEHLAEHVERFTADGADAGPFVHPELLDASSDFFACWPLAVLRSFKAKIERPLPPRVAEWIVGRIPLFEQTPVRIFYNERGRGGRWQLLSPAEASAADGLSYAAEAEAVIEELTGPDLPTPSGLLFGVPTGGQPNSDRWLRSGDECEVEWRFPFPGPPRYNARAFERVIIR